MPEHADLDRHEVERKEIWLSLVNYLVKRDSGSSSGELESLTRLVIAMLVALIELLLRELVVLQTSDDVRHAHELDLIAADDVQDVTEAEIVRAMTLTATMGLHHQVGDELFRIRLEQVKRSFIRCLRIAKAEHQLAEFLTERITALLSTLPSSSTLEESIELCVISIA